MPYYKVMVALLILFEFVVGLKMAIGVQHHGGERWWWSIKFLTFFLYMLISLIAQSLILVSIHLLDPWGNDALDLPAEEYLLLPLAGHRKLFAAPAVDMDAPPQVSNLFLSEYAPEDSEMLSQFAFTASAQGKVMHQRNFRRLDRWNTMHRFNFAAMRESLALGEAEEVGGSADATRAIRSRSSWSSCHGAFHASIEVVMSAASAVSTALSRTFSTLMSLLWPQSTSPADEQTRQAARSALDVQVGMPLGEIWTDSTQAISERSLSKRGGYQSLESTPYAV
uniref:Uncharacterized protein n=1 Tax=Haptolina brevifila TaxID=156173 RepID=A0A7S2IZC7_9EUKA